jgi:AraC-like DNA-binding protein
MKALFEKIVVPLGTSWVLLHRLLPEGIPFEWHYHPEFELTLTLNSRGQRFIGDHIGNYDDGDLVLLGPNLPHTWESRERIHEKEPHEVIVMWIIPAWISALSSTVPELAGVERLLRGAGGGLAFSRETAEAIRPHAKLLPDLDVVDRLPVLLKILTLIARDPNPQKLASAAASAASETSRSDQDRIDRVLNFIHSNYSCELSADQLAEIASLSSSALSRLFRRTMGATVTDYITRLRIGRACAMLIDDRYAISRIAEEVGYLNLANFNRQFLAVKHMQPSAFRKMYRQKADHGARP